MIIKYYMQKLRKIRLDWSEKPLSKFRVRDVVSTKRGFN